MTTNAMTKTMTDAYDEILASYYKAHDAKSFGEWYAGSDDAYEDWLIKRTAQLGERRVRSSIEKARRRYQLACKGIVATGASLNTVKALVARGYVELAEEYGLRGTAVRVISA